MSIVIEEFTSVSRNTLLGFARVRVVPPGIIIHDVGVHQSGDRYWASPPSKPMLGRDGTAITDASSGKIKYSPIITFASRDLRDRFSSAVIEALRTSHPAALGGGGAS